MRQALRLVVGLFLTTGWFGSAPAAEVRLFAAASLADVMRALEPAFAAATGHTLRMNFGSSGLLARQIVEGAGADVFFSADEWQLQRLDDAQLTIPPTRRVLAGNQLALVVPADATHPESFDDLTGQRVRRIALGEPATVPAGAYAKAYLETLGRWDAVAPKIVPLDNVRAVLAAVAAGNVDAGVVYHTDVKTESRVRLVALVPPHDGPRIRYPAVVLKGARDRAAADALLKFLVSEVAQDEFARHGFLPAPE
jgi:molybdate transport system substrate-binding protein